MQDFPDLKYVDAVELLAFKPEQQQLKAVLPDQLSTLINRIQYTGHASFLLLARWVYDVSTVRYGTYLALYGL